MPQLKKHVSYAARQAAYRQRCRHALDEQMRQRGLPALPAVPALPGTSRWNRAVMLAYRLLEQTCEEMRAYSDERSETWQESERAEEFYSRLEQLEEVRDQMEALL